MAQQTAVEWLIEKIHKNMGVWIPPHIQDQAKAMEKEQREQAKAEGHELAMSEAIKEIHKNYKPI